VVSLALNYSANLNLFHRLRLQDPKLSYRALAAELKNVRVDGAPIQKNMRVTGDKVYSWVKAGSRLIWLVPACESSLISVLFLTHESLS
jgi:hypothetical protein